MLTDPWFYAVAVPAVILVGLSKGGFAGGVGFVGVPLMSLVMSPVQAAAILLPILCLMDVVSLWTWRGVYDRSILWQMLPSALLGVVLGWAFAALVTPQMIKLAVGLIAIVFVARQATRHFSRASATAAQPNSIAAGFWGLASGFTSFVAHVGGPPFQIYTLPLKLEPGVLVGTTAIFFAVTNAVKLIPYYALGQFDAQNLGASLVLMPLAPLSTLAGAWLVRRMSPNIFYPLSYATVGLIALKLLYDGFFDLLQG